MKSSHFDALVRGLLSAIFPPSCASCACVGREPFCRFCFEALEPAEPFSVAFAAAARARFSYGGPAATAVHRFKYGRRPELGRTLGACLLSLLPEFGAIDCVVPVPMPTRRLRQRGFNQARELARVLPLPIRPFALARRASKEQVGLSKQARLENPARAIFRGREPVSQARVLLVDDVVTTGATARACVEVLLEAGAKSVSVLAFARTDR